MESVLELLLKNLDPNLACEIKDCWINPEKFTVDHLLGKGMYPLLKFGVCWTIVLNFLHIHRDCGMYEGKMSIRKATTS